jgi:hypothetical protein
MKSPAKSRLHSVWMLACALMANPAFADDSGPAVFSAGGKSYLGRFSVADRTLSVEIDGMRYRGNFSETASSQSTGLSVSDTQGAGLWGRAFLFASSANILQCQLDSGFPKLKGTCRSADGRDFRLEADHHS